MVTYYKTTTMLPAVEAMPRVPSFLRETFFPRANDITVVTENVMLDYKKGKRKMAPFVAPRVGGITVARDGFKTSQISPPRIAPERPTTRDDAERRGMGEDLYSKKTPAQRQVELTAKDLQELGEQIDRREEWMAAQVLFQGKVVMKGFSDHSFTHFIEQEIDYGFDNYETLSGTDLWTSPDSNPYNYMMSARKSVLNKGGLAPNIAILGEKACAALLDNPKIKDMLDKMNMSFGVIQPSLVSDQITFIGKLPGIGLELYTYDDWYIDEDGEEHPFVPEDKILIARKNLGQFIYGAVTQIEQDTRKLHTYEASRVPKFWADVNNDISMTRLTSRPVPQPINLDSWMVATVV